MAEYDVFVKPSADKALRHFPESVQKRIVEAMVALENDPRPPGVAKLTDADNLWRIRVGQYRIIFEINDSKKWVMVLRIAHRKDAY